MRQPISISFYPYDILRYVTTWLPDLKDDERDVKALLSKIRPDTDYDVAYTLRFKAARMLIERHLPSSLENHIVVKDHFGQQGEKSQEGQATSSRAPTYTTRQVSLDMVSAGVNLLAGSVSAMRHHWPTCLGVISLAWFVGGPTRALLLCASGYALYKFYDYNKNPKENVVTFYQDAHAKVSENVWVNSNTQSAQVDR